MRFLKLIIVILFVLLVSCNIKSSDISVDGIDIIEVRLSKDVAFPKAEISGLDWFGNKLILLPQYPDRFSSDYDGSLLYLSKEEIIYYISNKSKTALNPKKIDFITGNIEEKIKEFQGYEAIAFKDSDVYLTIESEISNRMSAYIIKGKIDSLSNRITLDTSTLKEIPVSVQLENMAFESLLIINEKVVVFFEANGNNVNEKPLAISFDLLLENYELLSFPNIEYRITDATRIDTDLNFWCINYMYEGETNILKPGYDSLLFNNNQNKSNSKISTIERLVKFSFGDNKFIIEKEQPIQIKLIGESKNWEGIVKLDDHGFLIITDRFPNTIMAYLPYPINASSLKVFENMNKFGYKNKLDIEIISPVYDFALDFSPNGMAAVVDDAGWIYINKRGEKIIRPYVVDNGPDYFSYGLARFTQNEKFGFFDEHGCIIIEPEFDFTRSFKDSVAAVCQGCNLVKTIEHVEIKNGMWGFINLKGELIIPFIYDSVGDFNNGIAEVVLKGNTTIISRNK